MLRRLRPLYFVEVVSHRHLRYASGLLHVVLLGVDGRAGRPGRRSTRSRSGCSSGCSPRPLFGVGVRALLRARHVGHAGGAGQVRASRRAVDVGGGGGDALTARLSD